MTTRIRAAALLPVVVLPLAGACGQNYGGSSGNLCHASGDITLTTGVVIGTVTASCSVKPTVHHMTVFLRYQPGGAAQQARGTMATRSSDQLPGLGADVTLQARHTCLPGTWWVQYIIAGNSPDGTPFGVSGERKYGVVSMDDCNRP